MFPRLQDASSNRMHFHSQYLPHNLLLNCVVNVVIFSSL